MSATQALRVRLRGAGGEPVDLRRTLLSHGLASLPPMHLEEHIPRLEVTLPLSRGHPRTIRIEPAGRQHASVRVLGGRAGAATRSELRAAVAWMLRLDEDLSPFYAVVASDPDLAWACTGAGRMIRSATVYEEVVKTVCTTNCSWGLTKKMIGALVEHLGAPAAGAPRDGVRGRAFPTPQAMASVGEDFYREVARAGYRSPYLLALARFVAGGEVDLERLGRSAPDELPDADMAARLRALPGVGPYAATHIMMMLGRYSQPILDSWSRPKYARVAGVNSANDAAIIRRFRRYGRYAGLAFWLFVTRDWVDDLPGAAPP